MIVEPEKPGERTQQLGNKTECGLLGFVNRLGSCYNEIRKVHPEESLFKVYTFNSSRKMMMTVIRLEENGAFLGYRVISKGASEILLGKCTYFIGANGEPAPFTEEWSQRLRGVIENMAQNGLVSF
jgi:Ca2+ transporting ATPase